MNGVIERAALPISIVGTGAAPAVSMRGVSKRCPERRGWIETARDPFRTAWASILHDVSCDVAPGEFFGLLGPKVPAGRRSSGCFCWVPCTTRRR